MDKLDRVHAKILAEIEMDEDLTDEQKAEERIRADRAYWREFDLRESQRKDKDRGW